MHGRGARVAVVGHVEWVQFARVARVPRTGEVMHAGEPFEEPAGGGAVAAVQLARLASAALLVTALGDDEHGRRSLRRLEELGVEVRAAFVSAPTRRAITLLDDGGERTIITLGERLDPPDELVESVFAAAGFDGVYFTAGDVRALRAARAGARVLTASPRAVHAIGHGVELDALILSARDELERGRAAEASRDAAVLVMTEGASGGSYSERSGGGGRWRGVAPPGPVVDGYGCGDSFAGGLTFGLASGMAIASALELAARCGALCASGRGPYARQLRGQDV